MKEPPPPPLLPFPPSRLKKLQSPHKIKILCSFNGDFLPCPPSGKLRYIGGETRIISISRGIGISQLISKISDLCPKYPSLSIKYQVLEQGGDLPLVPVETDEDIRHMILEYDKLVADGKKVRLRVFACCANGNGYVGSHAGSCCYFNSNRSVLARENTSENEIPMTLMDRICNSNDLYASNDLKQKFMSTQFAGVQNSDESYGPVAHSRRILSTQIAGTQNSHDFFMIDASGPKNSSDHVMKFVSSDNSFSQRALRPQNLTPHITGIPSFVGSCRTNSGPQNMTFYRTDIQSLGSSHDLPEFQSESSLGRFKDPFDSAGCNESVRAVEFPNQRCNLKQGFRKFGQQCMEEVTAENIVPGYVYCYPVETSLVPVTCSGNLSRDILPLKAFNGNDGVLSNHNDMAINHQICKSNIKDNRINSYDTQNLYNNLHDIQNLQDCGFNGKPCNGKYYSGPMSRSNTLELGQARFNLDHLSKPSYGAYDHVMEGMEKVASSGRGTQTLLHHDGSRGALQERVLKPSNARSLDRLVEMGYGNSNLHRSHFENCCLPQEFSESHNLSHHVDCCPRSPCNVTDKQTCFGTISVESGLLCDSYLVNPEVPSTSPCNKPFNNINKFSGVCKDSSNYPESNAAHFRNLNGNSSKLNGDSESAYEIVHPLDCIFEAVESSAKESASDSDLNEKSPEDLSLHFLSFSSPKAVGPSSQSSPLSSSGNSGSNEGLPVDDRNPTDSFSISIQDYASPRCEMWPYFKQLNPIDSKPLGSGLLMENLTEARIHRTDDDEKSYSIDPFVEDLTRSGSSSKLSGPFSLVAAHVSSNTGNGLDHGEGKQQSMPSNLNMEEKANVEGSDCCSTAGGQTGSTHLAFSTHLGTQELQTIRNSDLEEIREVGSGTYGTVYYGKWKGCDVAIKRMKPSSFNGGDLGEDRLIADFWKEAHLLGQLHHPNVVAFYGVVTDGPAKSLAAVTEYMVNGSLKQVLQRKDRTIDRRKRLIIAMDVAFGMEYLHEKNIVHFDLKSHNLLVNMRDPHRPVCKIGDLGLYKVKQRTLISGGVRGTIPWMAPELLSSKSSMVTEKVDVYSFGIVMWELLTGEEPYASMRSAEILAGIIKGDLRPEIPNWCDPAWKSLMERCWSPDPNSRPSFSEISKELRTIAASMNIK